MELQAARLELPVEQSLEYLDHHAHDNLPQILPDYLLKHL